MQGLMGFLASSLGPREAPSRRRAMDDTAIRRFGFPGASNDEADAWILRLMALAHYDLGTTLDAAYQREALAKIAWPVLDFPSSPRMKER